MVAHDETEPVLFYMRAKADYVGKHAGELSFREGDVIAVTKADTEHSFSQLWRGVVRGLAGEFPKARARKIENLDEPDGHPAPNAWLRSRITHPEAETPSSQFSVG